MRNLTTTSHIIYSKMPPLSEYMKHFQSTLNKTYMQMETEDEKFNIIFMNRHVPHLIGLHYFEDKKSSNYLLTRSYNLAKKRGFNNMLDGKILWKDLMESKGGIVWKDKSKRLRVLSLHLLKQAIYSSDIYKIDGKIKNTVRGKYMLVSKIDGHTMNIILDEDKHVKSRNMYFCCITNLIDDGTARRLINSGKVLKLNPKYIIHRNYPDGLIKEVKPCRIPIDINNTNVLTKIVEYACVKELLDKDCNFYCFYAKDIGIYSVSYYYFDINTTRIISRYI